MPTPTASPAQVTRTLDLGDATLTYDVRGALPPSDDDEPPLVLIGHPMDASGFTSLAAHLADRTLVTTDPRGVGRSPRRDGLVDHDPVRQADDLHALVTALVDGPADVFASSGGAVTALAWAARHPGDLRTVVAHEPPILTVLPDAEAALAAERAVQATYRARGWGAGMAHFIALTSWQGEFGDAFAAAPAPDPTELGLPAEDDGARDDPLLSGASNAITAHDLQVDALGVDALRTTGTRLVIAAGIESAGTVTWRTAAAVAQAGGLPLVEFPSHHGGFLGGEFGQHGQPEAFAARLRAVLGA